MKISVNVADLIAGCSRRIGELESDVERARIEMTSGPWREEVITELRDFAVWLERDQDATVDAAETRASKLYRMLDEAERSTSIAKLESQINRINSFRNLLLNSSKPAYSVDTADHWIASLLDATDNPDAT